MRVQVVAALMVAAAVGLGFVHPFGDPRAEASKGRGSLLQGVDMPSQAKEILIGKCADCHSSETRWPVYARVAPGSWLIERDIVEARKKMDLSHWEELPPERQRLLAVKIVQQARRGSMPPVQYLGLHWGAKLSREEVQALSTLDDSAGGLEAAAAGPGDAARGKATFEKRCTGCHALDADREGPRLAGVYGRKAGSVAGFDYSRGLKSAGFAWDEARLETWLRDPEMVVSDANMDFSVPKAQERADIIAYFKQR